MSTIKLMSFRISTVAYKHVQPFLLEIYQDIPPFWKRWVYKLFKLPITEPWVIRFTYVDQKLNYQQDRIFFETKEDAARWYNYVFEAVFLEKDRTPTPSPKPQPPAPPKFKKPVKPLEKLKRDKSDHLKVVKDETKKED